MNTHTIQQIYDAVDAILRQNTHGESVELLRNEHCQLQIELATTDQLACGVYQLQLQHEAFHDAEFEQLRGIADRIASNVNLLLEPLAVIEADEILQHIQLRSAPPQDLEKSVLYYEMLINSGGLTLCRYQSSRDAACRERTVSVLTYEMLARLCQQLLAAVEGASAKKTPEALSQ